MKGLLKVFWVMSLAGLAFLLIGCEPSEGAGNKSGSSQKNISAKSKDNIVQSGNVFEYNGDIIYTIGGYNSADDTYKSYKLYRQKPNGEKELLADNIHGTVYLYNSNKILYSEYDYRQIKLHIIDLDNDSITRFGSDEIFKDIIGFQKPKEEEHLYRNEIDFGLSWWITIKDGWAFFLIAKVKDAPPKPLYSAVHHMMTYDLVKVKLDGSKAEYITTIENDIEFLTVVWNDIIGCYKEGIYYCNKDNFLYKIDLNGNKQKLDCKFKEEEKHSYERNFILEKNYIYYIEDDINYKINLDTLKREVNPVDFVTPSRSHTSPRTPVYATSFVIDDGEYFYYNRRSYYGSYPYYTIPDNKETEEHALGLVKEKKDGTGETMLSNGKIDSISVIGDWVYFTKIDQHGKFFSRISQDSRKYEIIHDYPRKSGIEIDGWIYYINNYVWSNQTGHPTYRIRPDGTGIQQVSNYSGESMIYKDGWLYFQNNSNIIRVKLDGSDTAILVKDAGNYNLKNGFIYYNYYDSSESKHSVMRMNMDGSEKTKVTDFVIDKKIPDNNNVKVPIPVEEYENK